MEQLKTQFLTSKSESLQRLSKGFLPSSISELSISSRAIPNDRDFYYYHNFKEFKSPSYKIDLISHSILQSVGSSSQNLGKTSTFPTDLDQAYEWLVNLNDHLLERFDFAVDEFRTLKNRQQQQQDASKMLSNDGFQLVCGKKKKKGIINGEISLGSNSNVKVASRDNKVSGGKSRVPFHIPTIPRPQDVFKILVNNSNDPFQHVWLQRTDEDQRLVHPLEKLSVADFVDKSITNVHAVEPSQMEDSPVKIVEDIKDLKELASKLRASNEFAVDLEHNQYRSFQGMTCLMQISTRKEDFIVDTLKLRIHVGPYLREVFKDPSKKKVMHGADRDILWLQRDFGIYVCNMFDTGQASRVLKLERNSLEYLLNHFCGVIADKEYQNADWRLRPLPTEMLKYAREDTHYLLHIYDLMRIRLLSASTESENADLLEVYKRSYDVCIQLYEKELLTDTSYLHIYGLQGSDFNADQLAVVAGLCEWRDVIARVEDESTGYILPNKTLLEIAKQMPVTASKLRWLLKSKHPYVDQNLGSVVSIIRLSIQNASAFESAAQQLKKQHLETTAEESTVDTDGSIISETIKTENNKDVGNEEAMEFEDSVIGEIEKVKRQTRNVSTETSVPHPAKINTGATIQILKKPSCAFGALLGNSVPRRKPDLDTNDTKQMRLEQIKSTVNLPFCSFPVRDDGPKCSAKNSINTELQNLNAKDHQPVEDIISLDINTNIEQLKTRESADVISSAHFTF